MADVKWDCKKEKDLYAPKEPTLIDVPIMKFIMVDGKGDPNEESGEYSDAMQVLYALTYAIKMSKMKDWKPAGYYEYVVPPLEGLWWCEGGPFDFERREFWRWTSMIRQPEFVTEDVFAQAVQVSKKKNSELNFEAARLEDFCEGLCVHTMHIGPYATEPATIEHLRAFMAQKGLRDMTSTERKHHEIYLSDPRRTAPEKTRTVLRHPVARIE